MAQDLCEGRAALLSSEYLLSDSPPDLSCVPLSACVRACVRACMRACVRACVCVGSDEKDVE